MIVSQEYIDSLIELTAYTSQQENTEIQHFLISKGKHQLITHISTAVCIFCIFASILITIISKKKVKDELRYFDEKLSKYESYFNECQTDTEDTEEKVYGAQSDEDEESTENTTHHQIINLALDETDLDRKIELYTKAIELNPNDAEAYNNRGCAYDDKGEFDKAIKDYDKAIELNPNYAKTYNNKANSYLEMGILEKALEMANIAIDKDSKRAPIYDTRADIYVAMAEKEADETKAKEYYQKALDDCNTGLSLYPEEYIKKLLEENKGLCEKK